MVANGSTYNLTLVARTQGDVTALSGQLDRVTASAQRSNAAMQKSAAASSGWAESIKGAAVGIAAFVGVQSAGRFIIDTTKQFQQFDLAVTSFTGSTAVAGKALEDVQAIASKGFDIAPLLRAEATFLSLGLTLEESQKYVETIAKMSASLDAGGVERVALAFSQMAAKGKISLEEIRQLGEAGVPALQMFADAAGVSVSEFQKLASQGKIFSKDVLPEVIKQVERLYGGAYANRQDSLFGGIGKAKVDAQELAMVWSQQLTPAITAGLGALSGLLGVAQKIPPQMAILAIGVYKLGPAMAGLRGFGKSAADMFAVWRVGARGMGPEIAGITSKLGKMKAGLAGAVVLAGGALASGLFAADAAANIDLVNASLLDLAETQNLASLSSIKYADSLGMMMQEVNDPGFLRRAQDFGAAVGAIVGIGPGRSKDTAEFLQNMQQIDGVLANMVKSGKASEAAKAFEALKASIRPEDMEAFLKAMPQYTGAMKLATTGVGELTNANNDLAESAKTVKDAYDRMAESVVGPGRAFIESAGKMADYAKSMADASAAIDKSRKVSGDERAALLDAASATLDVIENQIKAGTAIATVEKRMKDSRATFIDTAKQMGYTADEAKKLADNAGLVPANIGVAFKATGLAQLAELNRQLSGISDYERMTGGSLGSQRMEINAQVQTQMSLIASQTIPVAIQNWPGTTSSGTRPNTSPGRAAGVSPYRSAPTRMVSV